MNSHLKCLTTLVGRGERTVQQLAVGTDEGVSPQILGVARLFADEHDLSFLRAFAKDGLRTRRPQLAALAFLRGLADARQRPALRNVFSRGLWWTPGQNADPGERHD